MEFTQLGLLAEKLTLVRQLRYRKTVSIPVWRTRMAKYTEPIVYENYSDWTEITLGTEWVCHYDDARWFEAEITVPEDFAHQHLVLELNLGGEGLVSVNGEPMGSLAFYRQQKPGNNVLRHRTRIELGDRAAGDRLHISAQMNMNYKDHYKEYRFVKYDGTVSTKYTLASAKLCVVDDDAEQYAFDAQNLMDAIKLLQNPAEAVMNRVHHSVLGKNFEKMLRNMNRDSVLTDRMIEALQRSMLEIPFYTPKDQMRGAMHRARQVLAEEMDKLPDADRGSVSISGLAHIDLVWLWQEKHSVRKVANTLLNTLALIQRYPEYIFTVSQPLALQWLETHYPQVFEKVVQAVKDGNIDPVSNLWVEMDCNLTGGEAMIRQLLYGRAYYLGKFGKCSDIFLMPDSFGYSGALPQIMAKSGVKYFLSAKLNTNEGFRFPHTLFLWQGIDGTKVPTYLMRHSYNSDVTCEDLDQVFHRQENKRLTDDRYLTFGYGDGGGGPDYTMLENYRRLQHTPGIPKPKMEKLDTFFERITQNQADFPVWNDELYFDRHRGTYTTQAKVKKNNRRAELALRKTEMAASLREILLGIPYPAKKMEEMWKQILHLQFHDSLPGSAITPVYDDAQQEYDRFFQAQSALLEETLADLTGLVPHDPKQPVLWNFLSWDRAAEAGDRVVTVPAMGWTAETGAEVAALSVSKRVLENGFFRVELDEKGRLVSLIQKESGRETLSAPSNVLELFEDIAKPRLSAWDIHAEYANVRETLEADSIQVIPGKTEAGVRLTWHFGRSTVTQDVLIYAHIPRVDFKTHVDWQEDMRMLKAAFYPKVRSSRAAYEIQFGALERPTHRNTEYDDIRFEGCGHKWADLSQGNFGVSILNDSKYGYDILDDRMRITLLRAPLEPDYKADRGEQEFTYSLYPHAGSWEVGGTVRAGFELNVPVDASAAACTGEALAASGSLVRVESASVVLDTFKKAEDGNGYILRLYESCASDGAVKVTLPKPIRGLYTCDMMEQENAPVPYEGNSFTFETTPYCIHTYRVLL